MPSSSVYNSIVFAGSIVSIVMGLLIIISALVFLTVFGGSLGYQDDISDSSLYKTCTNIGFNDLETCKQFIREYELRELQEKFLID